MCMDKKQNENLNETQVKDRYRLRIWSAAALLILFLYIAGTVAVGRTGTLDAIGFNVAFGLRGPASEWLLTKITFCGGPVAILSCLVVLLILPWTRKTIATRAAITGIIGFVGYRVLKTLFARPRPDALFWLVTEHGYSFPSGHSMNGMICYGIVAFLACRELTRAGHERWAAVVVGILTPLIGLIGLSRVFVGVHYFTDVLAGFALGGAYLLAATVVWDRLIFDRQK